MFGISSMIKAMNENLEKLNETLIKYNEEFPERILNSEKLKREQLLSEMRLSENEIDEILKDVRKETYYINGDEASKLRAEVYFLNTHKKLLEQAKSLGYSSIKELDEEVERYFQKLNK